MLFLFLNLVIYLKNKPVRVVFLEFILYNYINVVCSLLEFNNPLENKVLSLLFWNLTIHWKNVFFFLMGRQ